MSLVEVKCGECGFPQQLDEALLNTQVKCPKCKETFYAETGDAYGLADEPPDGVIDHRLSSSGPAPSRPRSDSSPPKPAGRRPEPKPQHESKEDRALRERMEKWAKKMEE